MAVLGSHIPLDDLNTQDAEALLKWAADTYGERAGIVTSFQTTGCVTIDLAARAGLNLRVLTIDTLRLPPETYEVIEAVERRYGIRVERFQPDPERLRRMVEQHGEYLFFDSKPKQEYCCSIRKVEPNGRALATLDLWITGLRRDQSSFRKEVPKATVVNQGGREIVKLSPLADWGEQGIWDHIRANDVPYNRLYDQGYTSIGCVICTTPTRSGEDKRAGRWRWFNQAGEDKKECGIHIGGSGI
ncbi:MAG: phosphoadenylyl-sulfate reductase [FCB group bacterium]|jgi:phosphoadenylyl-sulfate reductase (thioredoxin)|nr:phosphoadenylyl-sulfate reductase [FCB group bacterium]